MDTSGSNSYPELKLRLGGYVQPPEQLHRNVLLEQLLAAIPKDPQVSVRPSSRRRVAMCTQNR